jgi:Raf kinase inhibitor-like YbhB/YbcL family protein
MKITSPAFKENSAIPARYTCDGEDVSPPLEWSDLPENTKTVALICDDPDAPKHDFAHWVMFNVSPEQRRLAEHVPAEPQLASGARQGKNDFGRVGYGGPCPPSGTHRYRFALYALDTELDVPPSAPRDRVLQAMHGHVLETAELKATYSRT